MLTLLSGDEFSTTFENERNSLMQSAAITPYETRELLKAYLESLSSRFKVGLLFGAKKTAEERERRKQALADNMGKLVHAQIEVHLKTLMKKSLKEAGILTDDRSLAIDGIDLSIPFADIEKEFNVSDVITGDTVLNYSERMKTAIHAAFRRMTDEWKHDMALIASTAGDDNTGMLEQKVTRLEEKLQAIQQVEQIETQLATLEQQMDNPSTAMIASRDSLLQKWETRETLETIEFTEEQATINPEEVLESMEEIEQAGYHNQYYLDSEKVVAQAIHIAESVVSIPGFLETADYLRKKADRLDGQEFTIALFGAFSAGKSSFSNALIGENVLPVSPNPTTAAINRIRPISAGKEDNTADVLLKTEERMLEDVSRSFEALGL